MPRPNETRVAAICYAFPVTTQTFHQRRLRAMAEFGVLDGVYFVKPGGGRIEERSSALADHARPIHAPWWRTVLQLCRPGLLVLLIRCVLLVRSRNNEGGRIGAVWQAMKGIQLGLQLRHTEVTVIHATFATAPATVALFAATVAGLPFSVEVHSPTSAFANPRFLAMKLRAAALVVAISRYAERLVTSLAPGVSAEIVHCGIDVDHRPTRASQTRPASSSVLAVGSLQPKKGHLTLIRASAALAAEVPHSLAIAGDGPDRERLEAEIRRLGAPVELLGELSPDDVAARRRRADVGVLASVRAPGGNEDGVPVALMEFMADGVPVVGTDVAGIAELLADGEAGAVTEPGCADSLVDALRVALTDVEWRRARAGFARRVIEEDFSNRTETRRLVDKMQSLIGTEPHAGGDSETGAGR